MVGAEMSDQNGIIDLNWGALLFETEVGIQIIDYPCGIYRDVLSGQRGLLFARNWRIHSWAKRSA